MDFDKWYTANWTFSATQFRQENVKVKDGRLYLRVNRGESYWDPSASVNSVDLAQNDTELQSTSELQLTLSMPEFQVTGNSSDTSLSTAVVAEPGDFVQTPEVSVQTESEVSSQTASPVSTQTASPDSVQTGSTDPLTLWILAAGGYLMAQRRRLNDITTR